MSRSAREKQAGRHRVMQVIVALYSFVFFAVIAYGYFYLAVQASFLAALVIAVLAASLAWFLAKFIGQSETGIRGHVPMFVLLLIISATGVFNSAMVRLEGDRIVSEAASDAHDRFAKLKRLAGETLAKDVDAYNEIIGLRDALFAEMRNPANCGQGPEARRILERLETKLRGFRPLSVAGGNACAKVAEVIGEYGKTIDPLLTAQFPNLSIIDQANGAQRELRTLQGQAMTDYSPSMLRGTKKTLADQNDLYRELYGKLDQVGGQVDRIAPQLDTRSVQNLGDATKIPMLFLDRLDTGSTYVYLALAVFFDWLMIYFFMQARTHEVRRPAQPGTLVGPAW